MHNDRLQKHQQQISSTGRASHKHPSSECRRAYPDERDAGSAKGSTGVFVTVFLPSFAGPGTGCIFHPTPEKNTRKIF